MMRSNQLLIGLLIAIFIMPLGLLMAFKRMVKGGNYTAIHDTTTDYVASGKTGHYSVVEINVPYIDDADYQRVLMCHLHSANEGHYEFGKFDMTDSIRVKNERDTLFIDYVIKSNPHSHPTYFVHYNIDLYLPDMKNIVVTGATLKMDSIDVMSNPDIGLHLNHANFQLGEVNDRKDNNDQSLGDARESDVDGHATPAFLRYGNLSVSAENSHLNFGNYVQIDTLALAIGKKSRLSIGSGFQVHQIMGAISDQTTVISNIQTVKMLAGLIIDRN